MSASLRTLKATLRRRFDALLRRVPTGTDGIARVGTRQIYILPTRAGMTYGAVMMVMLLGSLNYQNNLGLLFTFFLIAVGLIAMHHAWLNLLRMTLQVRGGPAVFAGESAAFEVSLRAEGRRLRHDIHVRKDQDGPPPVCVPAGDQRLVKLAVPAQRRGLLRLESLILETRHPMHLFRAWCHVSVDAATLVYPMPAARAPEPSHDAGDDRRPKRSSGAGAEDYIGLRAYRHGDSPRHIDWKAFARERGLLVKEYGGEQGQEVWIDWSRLHGTDPETRLALMTRQVLDASDAGVRFGLRLPDGAEQPALGTTHAQRCLTRLALFEYG